VQIKVHIVEKLNNQNVENQNPDKSTCLVVYFEYKLIKKSLESKVSTSLSTKSKKTVPPSYAQKIHKLGNVVRYDLLEIV